MKGKLNTELRVTPREQQVIELLSQGYSNRDIGERLNIRPCTVKGHIRYIALRNGISPSRGVRIALVLAWKDDGPAEDSTKAREAWDSLNDRQRETASLTVRGLSNKQTAEKIGTSEVVIKNCLRIVFDRLGVWTRLELAIWFRAHMAQSREGSEQENR